MGDMDAVLNAQPVYVRKLLKGIELEYYDPPNRLHVNRDFQVRSSDITSYVPEAIPDENVIVEGGDGSSIFVPFQTFRDLVDLSPVYLESNLFKNVTAFKISKPSKVQEYLVPLLSILNRKNDVVAVSEPRSGKSFGASVGLIQRAFKLKQKPRILPPLSKSRFPFVVHLCFSKQAAMEIYERSQKLAHKTSVLITNAIGKTNDFEERRFIHYKGADVVIATTGRLMALLQDEVLSFEHLDCILIDDADRFMNGDLQNELQSILKFCPESTHRVFLSGGFGEKHRRRAERFCRKGFWSISVGDCRQCTHSVQQIFLDVPYNNTCQEVLQTITNECELRPNGTLAVPKTLIFVNAVCEAAFLASFLRCSHFWSRTALRLNVSSTSSGVTNWHCQNVIHVFRSSAASPYLPVDVIVATDNVSTGMQFAAELIVNVGVPLTKTLYRQRMGRLGRGRQRGKVITLLSKEQFNMYNPDQRQTLYDIVQMSCVNRQDVPAFLRDRACIFGMVNFLPKAKPMKEEEEEPEDPAWFKNSDPNGPARINCGILTKPNIKFF